MAQLFVYPFARAVLTTGVTAPGALLYFYLTGTTTPAAVYADAGLTTPLANPVAADAYGNRANIFLAPDTVYRVVEKTSTGASLGRDADPVYGKDPSIDGIAAEAIAAATVQAEIATAAAEAAAAASLSAGDFYVNAAATNVPRGLTQASVGAITAGSGGTNGTFALGFSSGNFSVNPTGTFTVAGGILTAVTITGPGLYIGASPTVPTVSFAASSGLTGAAVALTAQFLIANGVTYWVESADATQLLAYTNVGGVATAVAGLGPIPLDIAAQTAAAAASAAAAAASAASVVTAPNGTKERWLALATAAGSGASSTVQDAMVTVEQQLYATGLINKIVRLNLRVGTSAAAARIPFVMRSGCGNPTETGTLSSFTQASGLTGFSLDTGLTFEKAGLGAYNLGMGAYVLSSPGGTPSAYVVRASDNSWGFSPLYSSGINFAFALMSAFSASPYDKPDVSAVAGGVYTAPVLGSMTCVRDKSGLCSTYRNGIYLPQIIGNAPVSNTPLTQNLYVDTVTFASGGDWVTDALTPGEVTQLHWIIHNFNVAIGRGVTAEGL